MMKTQAFFLNDEPIHIAFEMVNKGPNFTPGSSFNIACISRPESYLLSETYLFQKGDSVELSIKDGGLYFFKGKGSEKLNCQFQVYSTETPQSFVFRSLDLLNAGEVEKKLRFEEKGIDLTIKLRMEVLKSYKTVLTEQIYDQLYLDILSHTIYPKLAQLPLLCYTPPVEQNILIAQKYSQELLKGKLPTRLIDSIVITNSAYYAEMLFLYEFNKSRLFSSEGNFRYGDSFRKVYDGIKRNYTGALRDKILYRAFERLGRHFFSEAISLADEALISMNDKGSKSLLTDWTNREFSVYPFALPDSTGKIHRLEDFKGKVLIIDFWFTGCPSCLTLSKAMKPIVEKFRSSPDVVFITVSTDVDKKLWLRSLSSQTYSFDGSVDLYTDGLGLVHPFITHYNFRGFPQQLIVSKDGRLITTSPPRVDLTRNGDHITSKTNEDIAFENTKTFIDIINKGLQD